MADEHGLDGSNDSGVINLNVLNCVVISDEYSWKGQSVRFGFVIISPVNLVGTKIVISMPSIPHFTYSTKQKY